MEKLNLKKFRNKKGIVKPPLKTHEVKLSERKRGIIEKAVGKTVQEYGKTLRLLGRG